MLDLKIHLIRLGTNQKKLAKQLGISTQYMSDIVHNRRHAPAIRLKLIALGMPADFCRPKKSLPDKHHAAA